VLSFIYLPHILTLDSQPQKRSKQADRKRTALKQAVASEVAAITHYSNKSKLKHAVDDVLKGVVD